MSGPQPTFYLLLNRLISTADKEWSTGSKNYRYGVEFGHNPDNG